MTTFELSDPALEPLTLEAEQRVTLGARAGAAPDPLSERIAIGRPLCRALDLGAVDDETRAFLEARAGSSFWLLGLTCSFVADDGEPMESAWLQVRMSTVSPDGAIEPVAWSMEPVSLSDPVQVSKTVSLDASLKLTSPTIPIEAGPSASIGGAKEYSERLPYVEAQREGTSTPSWLFTRTPVTDIRGVHRLRTVVELPTGGTGRADVSVGARVKTKLFGLVPYRSSLERLPEQQSVTLGA